MFYLIRSPEVEVAKLFSIWHSGEHGEVDIWVFMDLTNHTVEERSADSGPGLELLQQNPRYPDFKHKTTNEALWVDSYKTPEWVPDQLEKLEAARKEFEASRGESAGHSQNETNMTGLRDF